MKTVAFIVFAITAVALVVSALTRAPSVADFDHSQPGSVYERAVWQAVADSL